MGENFQGRGDHFHLFHLVNCCLYTAWSILIPIAEFEGEPEEVCKVLPAKSTTCCQNDHCSQKDECFGPVVLLPWQQVGLLECFPEPTRHAHSYVPSRSSPMSYVWAQIIFWCSKEYSFSESYTQMFSSLGSINNVLFLLRPHGKFLVLSENKEESRFLIGRELLILMGLPIHRMAGIDQTAEQVS